MEKINTYTTKEDIYQNQIAGELQFNTFVPWGIDSGIVVSLTYCTPFNHSICSIASYLEEKPFSLTILSNCSRRSLGMDIAKSDHITRSEL